MRKLIFAATVLAALTAVGAQAKPGGGGGRHNPDSNGDGVVTRAEVEANVAQRFARMDINKDGKVDKADREAAQKQREAKRGARRGGQPGGPDADGDGALSLDEMKRAAMQRFDRVDSDRDGKLTAAERDAARAARGERRRGASTPAG